MSSLKVRVQQDLGGDQLLHNGVVADIIYVGEDSPQAGKEKSLRGVVIPVGDSPDYYELEPGQYVLLAYLPTGELVIKDFRIPEDGREVSLELHSKLQSPHEWLSWHTFIGNVQRVPEAKDVQPFIAPDLQVPPPSSLSYRGRRMRFSKAPDVFMSATAPDIEPVRQLNELQARLITDAAAPLQGTHVWATLGEMITHPGYPEAVQNFIGGTAVDPAGLGNDFALYRFAGEGPIDLWKQPDNQVDYVGNHLLRQYLTLSSNSSLKILSLPVPWPQIDHMGEAVIELVVPATGATDVIDSNLAIRDREVGSALGYLTRGDLVNASALFSRAREMLFEKMTNPIGAAIGGYVLLSTAHPPGPWAMWLRNLMNWFDWLPDGAILYAWFKVDYQENDQDLKDARDALMLAYQRGLPFCSLGMGKLVELLRLFAEDDLECREALSAVQRLAWRTDMGEPFTMIDVIRDES